MKIAPALLILSLLLTFSFSGLAQTQSRTAKVYRCGADGKALQDIPCDLAGKESSVSFDQPSAAQTREAKERVQDEAKLARSMEKARLTQEAEDRRRNARAIGIDGRTAPAQAESASAPAKKKSRPRKPTAEAGR